MHILTLLVTGTLTLIAGYCGLYIFVLPHIFIHEIGHWIAGRLCRLQLERFRVGPIEFSRPGLLLVPGRAKWKWYWSWQYFWSGAIVMRASLMALAGTRSRYAIYILGGVAANIGSGLMALPVAMQQSSIGGFCKYFVLGAALMGIVNLIPFRARGLNFDSDGKKLLNLFRNRSLIADQMFWFTFAARLEELRAPGREGDAESACRKAEEFFRDSRQVTMPEELRKILLRWEASYEKARSPQSPASGIDGTVREDC